MDAIARSLLTLGRLLKPSPSIPIVLAMFYVVGGLLTRVDSTTNKGFVFDLLAAVAAVG